MRTPMPAMAQQTRGDGAANANDHANSDTPANSDTAGDRNEHGSERSTDHGSAGKTGD